MDVRIGCLELVHQIRDKKCTTPRDTRIPVHENPPYHPDEPPYKLHVQSLLLCAGQRGGTKGEGVQPVPIPPKVSKQVEVKCSPLVSSALSMYARTSGKCDMMFSDESSATSTTR